MKAIHQILSLTFILMFSVISCEKEEPEPEFRQGFSCKIDGEEWIAKTPASISGPLALEGFYNNNTGSLLLKATFKENDMNIHERIKIYGLVNIDSIKETEMITLDGNGNEHNGFATFSGNSSSCDGYFHDSLNPGNLKICSLDETKREISGTFDVTLINRNCQDSLLNITDGKFSFNY